MVALLFFYKNGFGIKQPMKVDIPLNNETEASFLLMFLEHTLHNTISVPKWILHLEV